jgi:hypothetical protein
MKPETTSDERITTATWRLRELKTAGLELSEILGGEAGASFLRDDCDRDPEVAYAAIALVYYPKTHEKRAGEQGKVDGADRHHDPSRSERDPP